MAAAVVARGHAVEEKGVDVVEEGFVVQEELREKAEVAAPGALPPAVDFEKGDRVVTVDLVPGWVHQCAFGAVTGEGVKIVVVAEAEFADVNEVGFGEGGGVGGKVPSFHLVTSHLNAGDIADAMDFRLILRHGTPGAELFNLFLAGDGH